MFNIDFIFVNNLSSDICILILNFFLIFCINKLSLYNDIISYSQLKYKESIVLSNSNKLHIILIGLPNNILILILIFFKAFNI